MAADKGLLEKQEERRRKIRESGIDYEFEGHVRPFHSWTSLALWI